MTVDKSLIRLTSGITGSGKTHFSLRLQRQGWVRFSLDELMLAFYGPSNSLEQWLERDQAIFDTLQPLLRNLVALGQPIIFDWSSETRQLRRKFVVLAESLGQCLLIDAFDIDASTAWQRIERRNKTPSAYPVDPFILETSLNQWQPPTKDEGANILWHSVPTG